MPDETSPWLNAKQAAAYVGRHKQFVLGEIRAGRLRAARIGGRGEILTCREWLDEWVRYRAKPVEFQLRRRG